MSIPMLGKEGRTKTVTCRRYIYIKIPASNPFPSTQTHSFSLRLSTVSYSIDMTPGAWVILIGSVVSWDLLLFFFFFFFSRMLWDDDDDDDDISKVYVW